MLAIEARPDFSLSAARRRCDEAREQLAIGADVIVTDGPRAYTAVMRQHGNLGRQ